MQVDQGTSMSLEAAENARGCSKPDSPGGAEKKGRKTRRDKEVSDWPTQLLLRCSSAYFAIESEQEQQQKDRGISDLRAAITGLPERQSQAARLVLLAGKSQTEAADIMGVKPQTVEEHIKNACKRLGIDWPKLKAERRKQGRSGTNAEGVCHDDARQLVISSGLFDAGAGDSGRATGKKRLDHPRLNTDDIDAYPEHESKRLRRGDKRKPWRYEGGTAHKTDPNSTQNQLAREKQAEIATYGRVLTVDEIEGLTNKKRRGAQARVLDFAGIRYRKRPDKSLIVTWRDVEREERSGGGHVPATDMLCMSAESTDASTGIVK